MIYNYAKLKGDVSAETQKLSSDFKDSGEISSWAEEAMSWCVMKNIINGVGNNLLMPKSMANRAEAVTMLYRYFA